MSDINDTIRNIIDKADWLPADGLSAPDMEAYPVQKDTLPTYQVQKILTEIYVFTDTEKMQYGSKTFQDVILMGEMTKAQVDTIIENKMKRKRRG